MSIPNALFNNQLHAHQRNVLRLLDTPIDQGGVRLFDLNWHRKSRKTTLAINALIRGCCKHPKSIFSYVAPTYKQARGIVWEDPNMLDLYLPDRAEMDYKKNEQKLQVKFANGSVLRILGADDVDSLRGPDNMGVVFDEWQLVDPTAWTAVFFPMINLFPDRWAMFLWTAFGRNHSRISQEIRAKDPKWFTSTLSAYDVPAKGLKASGLLSASQLEAARKEMPEPLYRQEYGCEDIAEEEMCLINSAMIEDLTKIDWDTLAFLIPRTKKIVSIDTAFGGDICSIRGIVNTKTVKLKHCHPSKTEEIVLLAKVMAQEIGTKNFISDCIGWGKGVTDSLAADAAHYFVQYFNGAENKSLPENTIYANMRAASYGYTAEQMRLQKIQAISDEPELVRQLPKASKYKPASGGKMLIVPKLEVRKDLGCSPDDSDSFVMGQWGLQFVQDEETIVVQERKKKKDGYFSDKSISVQNNPMICC